MSKNITAASNVIPFDFGKKQVRVMLIDDQPWFCAADVCAVLEYANSRQAIQKNCREKGVSIKDTPTNGGVQAMTFIDEGNLYRLIIKSRKEESQRFESWVCDEVLPAIRKHGRYIDENGKIDSLVGAVIGTSGVLVLDRVIEQKASPISQEQRRSFKHTMKSRLRNRFNVQRTDLIPAEKLADACNFIAAYAIEGEWIGREQEPRVKGGTFADILGRPMTPSERWVVYSDSSGNEQHSPIPYDACILTHRDLIKGMLEDIPVSTEEMFEFVMAAVANLKVRHDSQAGLVKAGRAAA